MKKTNLEQEINSAADRQHMAEMIFSTVTPEHVSEGVCVSVLHSSVGSSYCSPAVPQVAVLYVVRCCVALLFQAELQAQDGRTKGIQHAAVPERQHSRGVAQRGPHPAKPQRQGRQTQPRRGRERARCM